MKIPIFATEIGDIICGKEYISLIRGIRISCISVCIRLIQWPEGVVREIIQIAQRQYKRINKNI